MEGIWLVSYIVLWILVLALGVLILLLYRQLGIMYLGTAEGVSRDGLPRGTRAPDFNLTDQYGNVQRLSEHRGRPVLLLFGSPHCSPCRTLLPQLHDWARSHAEVDVIWLNAASPEESLKFVSDTGATLPIAPYAPEDNLMDRYRVRVTPFLFMVDEQGVIRAKGLANTKAGIDLYYKEMRTGSQEPEEEIEQSDLDAEREAAQESAERKVAQEVS
jgi:methylamine dehydrogenase accessory protein MauD